MIARLGLFAALLTMAGPALAAPPQKTLPRLPYACADFTREPSGFWCPNQRMTIHGEDLPQAKCFRSPARIGRVDLGALLEKYCHRHPS